MSVVSFFKFQKKKGPSRSYLEKVLDRLFQIVVVKRDPMCRFCEKRPSSSTHHIFRRGHDATRWLPKDGVGLCYECHPWAEDHPAAFLEWVLTWMPKAEYDELDRLAHSNVKFTVFDLQLIREELEAEAA